MDIFPRARRVLLTAYADTEAAITAINVVDLDHYLLKPWDPPEEKLYPVVDALLEAWLRAPDRPTTDTRIVGHRWSARSYELRDLLARNQVPFRFHLADDPEGARLLDAAGLGDDRLPVVVTGEGADARRAGRRRGGRGRRALDPRDGRLLRPRGGRRRPGRARRRGLRRLRGAAHRAGRVGGHRRAGRHLEPHRELPRLPRRRLRLPAHRPRPPAGGEVRRRGPHDADRDRPRRSAAGSGCSPSTTAPRSPRTRWSSPWASPTGPSTSSRGSPSSAGEGVFYGAATTEAPLVLRPGRLRRRRRELRGPGRDELLPLRPPRGDAGARRVARRRRCRTTSSSRSRRVEHIEVRTRTEVVGGRRRGPPAAADPARPRRAAPRRSSTPSGCSSSSARSRAPTGSTGVVARDDRGFVLDRIPTCPAGSNPDREPLHLETSLPGVFAVGDVRGGSVKRVASAVGEGAMAVSLVHRWLENR